jgi:methylated-DNA-protein-cysteine methyltransferase related protein
MPGKRNIKNKLKNNASLKKELPKPKDSPSFFDDVFEVVRQIPRGRVTSYGAIAQFLGTRLSARMVGWAMNASHISIPPVPAQRVVNRNGILSGKHHFTTPTKMEELLKKDGIKVKDDVVVDFNKIFWDPSMELSL